MAKNKQPDFIKRAQLVEEPDFIKRAQLVEAEPDALVSPKEVSTWKKALLPRMSRLEEDTGAGKATIAGLLDVISSPFRGIATGAGALGEVAGYGSKGQLPPSDWGQTLARRMGQIAEGETKGVEGFGESIARDPANALMFAGPLLSTLKNAPAVTKLALAAKNAPLVSKTIEPISKVGTVLSKGKLAPALTEGAASASVHQAENIVNPEKDLNLAEAAGEVGLSALFPALAGVKGLLRKGSGGTLRAQVPAATRKELKEIEDIMDYATGKEPEVISKWHGRSEFPKKIDPNSAEAKLAVMRELNLENIPKGTDPRNLFEGTPYFQDVVEKYKVKPIEHVKNIIKRAVDPFVNVTKAWTKKGTVQELNKTVGELETIKKDIFAMSDKLAEETSQFTKMEDLFAGAEAELLNNSRLTPHRKQLTTALNKAFDNFVADAQGAGLDVGLLLPSQVNQMKITFGKQGAWKKLMDPDTGVLKTGADPDAAIKEVVYNALYKQARQNLENIDDVGHYIKEINNLEHEVIPFIQGLETAEIGQVGGFGKIAPLMGSGAAGAAGGFGLTHGNPGIAIPAMAIAMGLGLYSRNMPFGRSIYQVSKMVPDLTGEVMKPFRKGLSTSLFGPEDPTEEYDPLEEAMKRRLESQYVNE